MGLTTSTWTGGAKTIWNNAADWTAGVPNASTVADIAAGHVLNYRGFISVAEMDVSGTLNIANGSYLTVTTVDGGSGALDIAAGGLVNFTTAGGTVTIGTSSGSTGATSFDREFGRTLPQTRYGVYSNRYQARFREQAGKLADHLSYVYQQDPAAGALPQAMTRMVEAGDPLARDAWGNSLRVDHPAWMPRDAYQLRSAGPDKRFDNGDD